MVGMVSVYMDIIYIDINIYTSALSMQRAWNRVCFCVCGGSGTSELTSRV
jgi:hypothetical protein